MAEIFLCVLFFNNSIQELKNFFQHFKKTNPKIKQVYFRFSQNDFTLYCKDQIQSCYIINNSQIIEQVKIGNPFNNNQYIIAKFENFDDVLMTVNKILVNPKDVRVYFEMSNEKLYLTWNVLQQDDSTIVRQTEIEFIEEMNIEYLQAQQLIHMPSYILNQLATICKSYDASLRLEFYKVHGLYSLIMIVQTGFDCPSFQSLFMAAQHQQKELTQCECFFEINKNYIQNLIDLTSIQDNITLGLDSSPTNPLVLTYCFGQDNVEIGILQQFVIQRMYN